MIHRGPSFVASFAIAFAVLTIAATPGRIIAANGCNVRIVILGQWPGISGPTTSSDWFNVLGTGFDRAAPATITFSIPVIPWPDGPAESVDARRSTESDGSFKWTFRARDVGVAAIDINVTSNGCAVAVVADLVAPDTSIAEVVSVEPGPSSPLSVLIVLFAASGGAWAIRHRLGEASRR